MSSKFKSKSIIYREVVHYVFLSRNTHRIKFTCVLRGLLLLAHNSISTETFVKNEAKVFVDISFQVC